MLWGVELRDKTGAERKLVVAGYHTPNVIYARAVDGRMLAAASLKDHTDVELIMLDGLVGRTSPFARRQQELEAKTKSAQPGAVSGETTDAAAAVQPKTQSKRRSKKAPSHPTEPEPLPLESPSAGAVPDLPVEPAPTPNPPPPAPEPELRLPPARLD